MANISGILLSSISQIAGTNITSVINIGGLATSGIPGWPTAGPSCTTVYYGYSDGRRSAPGDSCTAPPYEYALGNDGVLYYAGACGTVQAAPGYYSDGATIFDFTNGILVPWAACGR